MTDAQITAAAALKPQTHLHAGGLSLQFGQMVGVVLQLPPQVGVLLAERLHLVGQLVVGSHGVGHLHTLQRLLQEDDRIDCQLVLSTTFIHSDTQHNTQRLPPSLFLRGNSHLFSCLLKVILPLKNTHL